MRNNTFKQIVQGSLLYALIGFACDVLFFSSNLSFCSLEVLLQIEKLTKKRLNIYNAITWNCMRCPKGHEKYNIYSKNNSDNA